MAIQVLEIQVCSCCWEGRVRVCWSAVAATMKGWENQRLGAGGLAASFPGKTRHWQNWHFLTLLALKKKKKVHQFLQSSPLASCPHMEELSKFGAPGCTTQIFAHCWRAFSYLWLWFTQEWTLKSPFWSSLIWDHLGINIIQFAQGSIDSLCQSRTRWVHKAVAQLPSQPKAPIKIVLSGRITGMSAVKAVYSWFNIAWL